MTAAGVGVLVLATLLAAGVLLAAAAWLDGGADLGRLAATVLACAVVLRPLASVEPQTGGTAILVYTEGYPLPGVALLGTAALVISTRRTGRSLATHLVVGGIALAATLAATAAIWAGGPAGPATAAADRAALLGATIVLAGHLGLVGGPATLRPATVALGGLAAGQVAGALGWPGGDVVELGGALLLLADAVRLFGTAFVVATARLAPAPSGRADGPAHEVCVTRAWPRARH